MSTTESAAANGRATQDSLATPLAIFETSDDEGRLSPELLERAVHALLETHPEAPVSAHSAEGVMLPMPTSIVLRENPVQEARSGMDLIAIDERVMRGWETMLRRGAAVYPVTVAGYDDVHGIVYAVDLRERHGVIVTVAVFDAVSAEELEAAALEPPELAPRFGSIRKSEHALITGADEAAQKMLGYDEEELVGRRSLEFIHPDDQPLAVDNWMQMIAFPGPARRVRLRHRRSDGSWAWLELTNHNLLHDPDYECMVSEIVDISEEMAAHELVDRLARAVPVGLLQINRDREIAYSNERLHEILGVEPTDRYEELLAGVAEDDRAALRDAFTAAIESGQEADVEVELRLPSTGELRRCSVGLRPLAQEGGDVTGAIACVADITESARMRDELHRRATFDELTGCYNRAAAMRLLEEHVASGRRASERAVMFVDVDGFKAINDRFGHAAGDELLRVVAAQLSDALRAGDIVGRMGGDEFLIVCPDIGGPENAEAMAQRLLQAGAITVGGREIAVETSIGVAWSRGEDVNAESLVAEADHAMYEVKREKASRAATRSQRSDRRGA
jgi:diguanylate cyclase (GGDEF)-like protein/PAS domain S-box-containing protein